MTAAAEYLRLSLSDMLYTHAAAAAAVRAVCSGVATRQTQRDDERGGARAQRLYNESERRRFFYSGMHFRNIKRLLLLLRRTRAGALCAEKVIVFMLQTIQKLLQPPSSF